MLLEAAFLACGMLSARRVEALWAEKDEPYFIGETKPWSLLLVG